MADPQQIHIVKVWMLTLFWLHQINLMGHEADEVEEVAEGERERERERAVGASGFDRKMITWFTGESILLVNHMLSVACRGLYTSNWIKFSRILLQIIELSVC